MLFFPRAFLFGLFCTQQLLGNKSGGGFNKMGINKNTTFCMWYNLSPPPLGERIVFWNHQIEQTCTKLTVHLLQKSPTWQFFRIFAPTMISKTYSRDFPTKNWCFWWLPANDLRKTRDFKRSWRFSTSNGKCSGGFLLGLLFHHGNFYVINQTTTITTRENSDKQNINTSGWIWWHFTNNSKFENAWIVWRSPGLSY